MYSPQVTRGLFSERTLFIKRLIDLWQIRKKDQADNPGLLPADTKIRNEITDLIFDTGIIEAEYCLWADLILKDRNSLNYSGSGFPDLDKSAEAYVGSGLIKTDPMLYFTEKNPNSSIIRSSSLDINQYRKSALHRIFGFIVDDSVASNIYNKKNDIVSIFTVYRTGTSSWNYFKEHDKEIQDFIITLLSFDPLYPMAICRGDGRLEYQDNDFFALCERTFPGIQSQPKLPSPWLAQLIKWNQKQQKNITYQYNDFKIASYPSRDLYAIQAVPKIFSEEKEIYTPYRGEAQNYLDNNFSESEIFITENKSYAHSGIIILGNKTRKKTENNILYFDKNKVIPICDYKKGVMPEQEKTDAEIIEYLRAENMILVLENKSLREENQELRQRNAHLEQQVFGVQSSVADIVGSPAPESPTPPEVAPVLFKGKQGQAFEFLKEHYGQYLTYFGAEQDTLFQYQLKKLDKRLYQAVTGWLNYQRKSGRDVPTFAEIVPSKKKETKQLLEHYSEEERAKVASLHSLVKQRKAK